MTSNDYQNEMGFALHLQDVNPTVLITCKQHKMA